MNLPQPLPLLPFVAPRLALCALLLAPALALLGCSDDKASEGKDGTACYPNGTCDQGLVCNAKKLCVEPGSAGASGFDLDACFACGDSACPTEASACEDSAGCSELLSCTLGCGADASCATGCDASKTTQQDVANMSAFTTCAVVNCTSECTPKVGAAVPTSTAGSTSGAGFDDDACFSCGDNACPTESTACAQSPACAQALACVLGCTNDTCASNCVSASFSADDAQRLAEFSVCATQSCTNECTPAAPSGTVPTTPGGPAPTGACTTEGERSGSCATGSLTVCLDGQWAADPCLICGVVTPEAQCADVRLVTLEERGTAAMSDLVGVANPEMDIVATGASLSAQWYLDVDQMGVVQFEFNQGIDPSRIEVQGPGSAVQYITLETPGGVSGCQYTLSSAGRLERYLKMTGSSVDWYGCWGDFEALTTSSEPTTTTIMNLRTPVSTANELRTMTITSVLL